MTELLLDEKTVNDLADIVMKNADTMESDEFEKFLKDFGSLKFSDEKIVQKYLDDNSINKAIE